MKHILTEDQDFTWGTIKNGYGHKFKCPVIQDDQKINPISDPEINSIVLFYDENIKQLYPIFIIEGNYEANGRISNFWYWKRLDDNLNLVDHLEHGYGDFYVPIEKYKVKVTYSISIE